MAAVRVFLSAAGGIVSGMGFLDRFRKPAPTVSAPVVPPTIGQPRFAVIDVETTGLSPAQHRILEIAVITTDPWGRVLDEWSTRVNPEGPVGATHIHGIRESDVANAPVFRDLIAVLNQRLAGAALAAHNATFDLAFLAEEFARAGWRLPAVPTICTLEASQRHLPLLDRRRLADCCWAVGTPLTGAHSALGDARATAGLLAAFMNPHIGLAPLPEHLALPTRALAVTWPASPEAQPTTNRPDPLAGVVRVATSAPARPTADSLVRMVDRFSLADAAGEGAPDVSMPYLEKIAEALEDGELSDDEAADLAGLAAVMNLSTADIAAANRAFVLALAHEALEDGKVSRAERAELLHVAELLQVDAKVVPALLDQAELARDTRLSDGLAALPGDWAHGEPLRVGDKVVFTGCEAHSRPQLESQSEARGVRVLGTVSPKVTLLVSDGTMDGGKATRARELGTRVVHPTEYRVLLEHLQPALPRPVKPTPAKKAAKPKPAPAPASAAPVDLPAGTAPSDVRAWGRENGWDVGVRGRLNHDLVAAFVAAQNGSEAG
ncbi:hypothetical protein JCM18899A_52020 [Nocardioides sp. AN3]